MQLAEHFRQSGTLFFRWRSRLPWLLVPAYAGTLLDFHYPAGAALDRWWSLACFALAAAGLMVRLRVSGTAPWGTSARNTEEPLAATLNVTGLYSVVRHPLYVGNYVIGLGLSLLTYTWYLPALFTLAFALYYERIILVEEAYLAERFGDAFHRWAARVPAFVPRLAGYRPPALPFSWRAAVRREFYGLSVMLIAFGAAGAMKQVAAAGTWRPHPLWTSLLGAGAMVFLVMRTLKKRTALLHVEGR